MVKVEHLAQLKQRVGEELGVSDWIAVTQAMFDQFGALTGDQHWIHVDPPRAQAEGPYGGTIAQGFLTLSLLTGLLKDCFQVAQARRWVNYGLDKVRFTAAVTPDQRLRLRLVLGTFESRPDGSARLGCDCTLEVEGAERPALVATFAMLGYE